MIDYIINIDKNIFVYLNNLGTEHLDFFWLFMSNKTQIFLFVFFCLLVNLYNSGFKKYIYIIFCFLICVGLTDFLHVQLLKNYFLRLRPCWEPDILIQMRPLLVDCGGYYGFVSGHAANSSAIVALSIFIFKRMDIFFKYSLIIWTFLVSFSRIYLGKHYLFDVIFGMLFGYIVALIVFKLYSAYNEKYLYD